MNAFDDANQGRPAAKRADYSAIFALIPERVRVLDVGCGSGDLLALLAEQKNVRGRGLELSAQGVQHCLARGLAVIQGDAQTDLMLFPDDSFDWVILSKTIQAMAAPDLALRDIHRIARHCVISFPNFGHWRVRLNLLRTGRMPVTRSLPSAWYDTQNIHLCSLADMDDFVRQAGFVVDQCIAIADNRVLHVAKPETQAAGLFGKGLNWRAEEVVMSLRRKDAA